MEQKRLLVEKASQLYTLGFSVADAKQKLQELLAQGVPYDSQEVTSAVLQYQFLQAQWQALEAQYLQLRKKVTGK